MKIGFSGEVRGKSCQRKLLISAHFNAFLLRMISTASYWITFIGKSAKLDASQVVF